MTTIYRTPPAHQNRVQQGNNSGEIYVSGGAKGERSFTDAEMRQLVPLLDAGGDPDVGPRAWLRVFSHGAPIG